MHFLLFGISLLPVLIILSYIYFKDKQEKESTKVLLKCFIWGVLIFLPIHFSFDLFKFLFGGILIGGMHTVGVSFGYIALPEEGLKWLVFMLLVWKKPGFSHKINGIAYSVFVALGFAAIENIKFVFEAGNFGLDTAFARVFTAVPAQATFGVTMGYFMSLAKYFSEKRKRYIFLSLLIPVFFHGFYDLIQLSRMSPLTDNVSLNFLFEHILFIPYSIFLLWQGFTKIKKLNLINSQCIGIL